MTFCEVGGNTIYPYSPDFLERNRERYTYDRYWRATPDHDRPDLKFNTRYLCSGFQFVTVGSESTWFFREMVRDHLRRHYFRLGLIAHFQRAALLKFADNMSEAIQTLTGQSPREELGDERFRERIEYLQMTFLKFVSRAWFSEVSNQLQGQELFQWWSGLLGNQRLFDEVSDMYRAMHHAITEREQRKVARSNLVVAAVAAVIAVVAVSFSMAHFVSG